MPRRSPPSASAPVARAIAIDVAGAHCTSRQHNTPSTESRSVVYPWHPWCGRSVTVYEVLTRGGQAVCRCGLDEERNRRSLEIPTWMFDPAACGSLRLTAVPTVDCDALLAVQAVLRTARGSATDDE